MSGRKAAGLVLTLGTLLWLAASPARAEPAQRFERSCASCHTVGEGDRAGPDLLGVTRLRDRAWLEEMIRSPSALFARGDVLALELRTRFGGEPMPDQPLADDELAALLAWLDDCSTRGGCRIATRARRGSEAGLSDIEIGRLLFEGRRGFSAGAPHCAVCHDVRGTGLAGGGTLGPNLTHAYARLGDRRIADAIERPTAQPMAQVYAERPLEPDESFQVRAWLAASARDGAPTRPDPTFPVLGALGFVFTLAALRTGKRRGERR